MMEGDIEQAYSHFTQTFGWPADDINQYQLEDEKHSIVDTWTISDCSYGLKKDGLVSCGPDGKY
jgi:hypothetical protein